MLEVERRKRLRAEYSLRITRGHRAFFFEGACARGSARLTPVSYGAGRPAYLHLLTYAVNEQCCERFGSGRPQSYPVSRHLVRSCGGSLYGVLVVCVSE